MRQSALMTLALCAVIPVIGTGCASQQELDKLQLTNKTLEEQLVRAENERDISNQNLEVVRNNLNQTTRDLNDLRQSGRGISDEMARLQDDYEKMLRRISELQLGPLPEDLTEALQQLAADHPNVLTFDPQTGMLRFASDFTFDLGSAQIRGSVMDTVQMLASILNSGKASGFEVRIIGHTDNVPIEKPDTRAKHPTNLHLSAHRAITVRDSLVRAGVDPVRCQIAGYGEFRPVVANGAKGAAANRRVEIYLVPMPSLAMMPPVTPTPGEPIARPTETYEPMK